jgi:ferrochelatase
MTSPTTSAVPTTLPPLDAHDAWQSADHEVLLCNFGGPEKPEDVEPFLVRLFEDPFIIRAPFPPWLRSLLARRIARKRAPKSRAEYEKIGGSPLNRYTEVQARHLERLLRTRRPRTRVHVVNRYTAPFASDVVRGVPRCDDGKARLFSVTLYPHLCHSTTVSSLRDLELAWLAHHGGESMPGARVWSWWAEGRYLDHTFERVKVAVAPFVERAAKGEHVTVLSSAHGLPVRYLRRGDPYVSEIKAHHEELSRRCQAWLQRDHPAAAAHVTWHLSFQSRVGPVEWVKPYTDAEIGRLGAAQRGALVLVPISFTADHIETLFEMDETYAALARASGFAGFGRAIPANDDAVLAACLADSLIRVGF